MRKVTKEVTILPYASSRLALKPAVYKYDRMFLEIKEAVSVRAI
jgi:lantibiotic modifying enzyme